MHKAGTVFHGGIRFPRFLTFVLPALFVAAPQADGRFQTAAAGCRSTGLRPSEDLSELPPLRSVVAGQVYHCRLAGSSQNSLPRLLPAGWVPLVTLLSRLYAVSCNRQLAALSYPLPRASGRSRPFRGVSSFDRTRCAGLRSNFSCSRTAAQRAVLRLLAGTRSAAQRAVLRLLAGTRSAARRKRHKPPTRARRRGKRCRS